MSISPDRRFSRSRPCPICGGHPELARGNGQRCYGFLSEDGLWAHCTREEYAGESEQNPESGTYAHKLMGDCRCGVRHDSGPADAKGPAPSATDTPHELEAGTLLSEVVEESVEWLWEGRIPLAKLTVIDGDPGTGKSALTTDLAARVSTGREMPIPKEANER